MWVVLLTLLFPAKESPVVLGCCGLVGFRVVGFRVVGFSFSLLLAFWCVLYTSICTLLCLFASAF